MSLPATPYLRYTKFHVNLDRLTDALAAYEQAIQLEPDNPSLYKEQGDILFRLEDWDKALDAYNTAILLKPDISSFYLIRSRTYENIAQQAYAVANKTTLNHYELVETDTPFHLQLKFERERYGWSQAELAEKVGVNPITVVRWENGKSLPQFFYLKRLKELFGNNAEEFGLLNKHEDISGH